MPAYPSTGYLKDTGQNKNFGTPCSIKLNHIMSIAGVGPLRVDPLQRDPRAALREQHDLRARGRLHFSPLVGIFGLRADFTRRTKSQRGDGPKRSPHRRRLRRRRRRLRRRKSAFRALRRVRKSRFKRRR